MDQGRNYERLVNTLMQIKIKTRHTKTRDAVKAVFIWKFRTINAYIKKRIQINNLNVHLKKTGEKAR